MEAIDARTDIEDRIDSCVRSVDQAPRVQCLTIARVIASEESNDTTKERPFTPVLSCRDQRYSKIGAKYDETLGQRRYLKWTEALIWTFKVAVMLPSICNR
jgi:hypothetical protein